MGEAVEALRRFAPDHARQPLVELEAHRALDILLAPVDERLQHLALGGVPEAVIDELGVARHQLVLEMRRAAVEGDAFDAAMRRVQDGAAGRLVDAARLHADEAVLDEVEAADAVLAAELVELRQERRRRQRRTVDGDGVAALELDLDIFGPIGRVLGRDGAAVDEFLGLAPGILERLALGRDVQEVGIDRERRLAALVAGDGDLVLLGIFDELGARGEVPFAPRCDHLDVRLQRIIGELEAHLVVAFAGGAMRHRVGADLVGDLDLPLGDERARDRGAEQVLALIERVGAEHREDEVAHELLAQILDEDLLDPHELRLLARRLELLALADIGGEGHHLALIGLLQPAQDHRGVEPAGISQDNFPYLAAHGTTHARLWEIARPAV